MNDNAERDRRLYKYPDTDVPWNKFDIRNARSLELAERVHVHQRIKEGTPAGDFDLDHLKAVHRHLFQDVYEWAGEIRKVNISKGRSAFHPHDRIEFAMHYVHSQVKGQSYLENLSADEFAHRASIIIGDLNLVHPFREGNGRTQFQYLKHLGERAGYIVDLEQFDRDEWLAASIEANDANYQRMIGCINTAITGKIEN